MASLPAQYKYKKTKKYKIQRNTKIQIKTQKYKHKSGGGMPIYGTSASPLLLYHTLKVNHNSVLRCITAIHGVLRCITTFHGVLRCITVTHCIGTLLHFYTLPNSTKFSVLNCTQLNNSAAHFDLYLYFTQHKEIQIQRNEHKYKKPTALWTRLH